MMSSSHHRFRQGDRESAKARKRESQTILWGTRKASIPLLASRLPGFLLKSSFPFAFSPFRVFAVSSVGSFPNRALRIGPGNADTNDRRSVRGPRSTPFMIQTINVSLSYNNGVHALRNVSVRIAKGD